MSVARSKRSLALLLGILLIVLLTITSCGGGAAPVAPAEAPAEEIVEEAAEEEVAAEEEPAEEEAAAAGEPAEEEAAAEPAAEEFTVGLMQLVTHPALDAGREGAIQALADAGFVEGENLTLIAQNAEGDIATLTTIAQSLVDQGVDLIIATSTPAAQAAFNVIKDAEEPIVVYNVVTDPFAAGLATAPDDHPDWIVGTQAMPPVRVAMETMLEILPEAERVGIIWNPAEKNSQVATDVARDVAEQLGIELIEANVSDSSEVQTAAESLIAQDIDAFFISTDSTVVAGFEALAKVANENQVPLFANDPASAGRGAAAAVGVDYFQDGYDSGEIAAQILAGEATPADFTIEPQEATILAINTEAAEAQGLTIPDEVVERAAVIYPEEGEEVAAAPAEEVTVGFMQFVTHPALDAAREGSLQALEDAGFVEGENLTLIVQNAEGDIATLTTIAQSMVDQGVDLIIASSTPSSQAAFNVIKDTGVPYVVYNAVTDPFAAGLATAPDDHPDWIVGTQAMPPVEDALRTLLEVVPDADTVGILYNPSEKNSQVTAGIAADVAEELGFELIEANVADSSEVQTAAESLVAQGVDAFFVSTDSTVVAGFEALAKVANENQVPLFANDPASAGRGAVAAVGLDYFQDGYDSGAIAAQILAGEATPADFDVEVQSATSLAVNTEAAVAQGVTIPDTVMERAATIFPEE